MFLLEALQVGGRQLFWILNGFNKDIFSGEGGGIILLLPLLTQEQEGALPAVETGILQGLLNEFGFACIQKTGKQVNRDFFHHICSPLCLVQAEQMVQVVLLQLRANDTQTAGDAGGAAADVLLPGHIVKMNPGTVGAGDDALGTEYDTILLPFI